MSCWFHNGNEISEVSIDDRAFQYGDGLFETIAIRDGQPRLWEYHVDRLERGCEKLRLLRPDGDALRIRLDKAMREGDVNPAHCSAKIVLSAGVSDRGYTRSAPTTPAVFLGLFSSVAVASEHYHRGVDTMLCETRLAMYSPTAGCKTLNRIEQVLARMELQSTNNFEGFTLDAESRVICGTMSNVFAVSDNCIATPSLDRCGVAGVMRRHTIETLRRRGVAVAIRDVCATELMQCDEVFICNSQFGILPVRCCGEATWHSHPVTRSVMSALAENGILECAQ